jgi:hypothetical protein
VDEIRAAWVIKDGAKEAAPEDVLAGEWMLDAGTLDA